MCRTCAVRQYARLEVIRREKRERGECRDCSAPAMPDPATPGKFLARCEKHRNARLAYERGRKGRRRKSEGGVADPIFNPPTQRELRRVDDRDDPAEIERRFREALPKPRVAF